jgi:hypothetical protein
MTHDPKLRQAVGRAIRDANTLLGWDEAATAALDATFAHLKAAGWVVVPVEQADAGSDALARRKIITDMIRADHQAARPGAQP